MNKNDRRAKKTEKALVQALSELLNKKQLHDITVNELVKKADLHRSTFYTHYHDIYDLYQKTEEAFFDMFKNYIIENDSHDYTNLYAGIIDYLDQNRFCSHMFLGENAESSFQYALIHYLIERYLKISAFEENIKVPPKEWPLLAVYHVSGNINLLKYWIHHDFSIPKNEMLCLMLKLDDNFDNLF